MDKKEWTPIEQPTTTTGLSRELMKLNQENKQLREICQVAIDTLGAIDEWLGSASTREAAMDSLWRLNKILQQAGFEYNFRHALNWRGASMKELNDAGFFKNQEDGFFHYDPEADKVKPYRIYGNAIGPTLKEYVEQRIRVSKSLLRVIDTLLFWCPPEVVDKNKVMDEVTDILSRGR